VVEQVVECLLAVARDLEAGREAAKRDLRQGGIVRVVFD
jgi:hypothetical protein